MDINSIHSKNGVLIRLTEERWKHIILMHPGLSGRQAQVLHSVKDPDYILEGKAGELLAVLKLSMRRYLVVVYKGQMALLLQLIRQQILFGYSKRS